MTFGHRFIVAAAVMLMAAALLAGFAVLKPAPFAALAQGDADTAPDDDSNAPRATRRDDLLGVTRARERFGSEMPIGRGIVVGMVEGEAGAYMPDLNAGHLAGVTIHSRSGESQVFGHANATSRVLYGTHGLAPGVREVHHFHTAHWLGEGYLNANVARPPNADDPRIYSHSWIADVQQGAEQVLRRVDYAIDQHNVIICAGVNNGRTTRVPHLLGSAYNVIAVGSGLGTSSGGRTRVEGDGRSKPDIAGPRALTSFATPAVAGLAACLLEAASDMGEHADRAGRAMLIKAVLMAGASKPWNWRPEPGRPLDQHLGAGIANLDHSLRILTAGPTPPNTSQDAAPLHGWDLRDAKQGQTLAYHFQIEPGSDLKELSLLLNWHRRIDGRIAVNMADKQMYWLDTPRLARFDLRLIYTDANGNAGLIGQSSSDVDNVQHIHLPDPPPGRYRLEVVRRNDGQDELWDYALAWRFSDETGVVD